MSDHDWHPRGEWTDRRPGFVQLGPTNDVFIHHTVSPEQGGFDPGAMRALEASEISRGGYVALAYHTVLPDDGCLVEARPEWAQGGATIYNNSTSRAICFIGNYMNQFPSDAQIDGAADQIARWVRSGKCRTPFRVRPHNSVFATACPGTHILERLDQIAPLALHKLASPTSEEDDMKGLLVRGTDDSTGAVLILNVGTGTLAWVTHPDALGAAQYLAGLGLADAAIHSLSKKQLGGFAFVGPKPPGW